MSSIDTQPYYTNEKFSSLLQHIAARCWSDWWIGGVAGHDMVLLGTNRIDVLVNPTKVDWDTFEHNLVGLDQVVLQVGIAQVERVRRAGHARAVGVPIEQVEGGRLHAQ